MPFIYPASSLVAPRFISALMDSGVAPLLLATIRSSIETFSASSSSRRSSSSAWPFSWDGGAIGASLAILIDILACSRGWLSTCSCVHPLIVHLPLFPPLACGSLVSHSISSARLSTRGYRSCLGASLVPVLVETSFF